MYAQGYNAYSSGHSYDSNPFKEGTSAYWGWSEGWLDAELQDYRRGMRHWSL